MPIGESESAMSQKSSNTTESQTYPVHPVTHGREAELGLGYPTPHLVDPPPPVLALVEGLSRLKLTTSIVSVMSSGSRHLARFFLRGERKVLTVDVTTIEAVDRYLEEIEAQEKERLKGPPGKDRASRNG